MTRTEYLAFPGGDTHHSPLAYLIKRSAAHIGIRTGECASVAPLEFTPYDGQVYVQYAWQSRVFTVQPAPTSTRLNSRLG